MTFRKLNCEPDLEIQNTRSMSMDPQPNEEFHQMDDHGQASLELLPVFSGDRFKSLVNYPVMVEMWDKKKAGRHKRAWEAEFTQAERNTIGRYYGRFYRWHLVSGTPQRVSCRLKTLQLLQRAVHFFGTMS